MKLTACKNCEYEGARHPSDFPMRFDPWNGEYLPVFATGEDELISICWCEKACLCVDEINYNGKCPHFKEKDRERG